MLRVAIIMVALKFVPASGHAISLPAIGATGLLFALTFWGWSWVQNTWFRRLAVAGSLAITDAGFTGSLDGAATTILWSDIGSVRNLDDNVLLMRRNAAGAIAIPKAQITDLPEFWTLLEERLVNQSALVRTPFPRTQIINNLC